MTTSDPSLLSLAQVAKLKLNFMYFYQFPFSQHIIVLDNGTIKAQGTFQDVKDEFPDNLTSNQHPKLPMKKTTQP